MSRKRAWFAILVPLALFFSLVTAAPVAAVESSFNADMTGDQEVPDPGDDDGFAFAEVIIDPEAGTVCWSFFWEQIAEPTAAHIHEGAAGVAGPPVVTFVAPFDGGCVDGQDQAALQAIVDDPAGYYVNLHTADFPGGAVRGQLKIPPITLFAQLSGDNEAPGPGDPEARGEGIFGFEPEIGQVCYDLFVEGAEDFTAAHIHEGATGVAGPPVITLDTPSDEGFAGDCLEGLDPALLQAIVDDPGGYYVNVHTSEYPDGAARGQLSTEAPEPPPDEECQPPDLCNGIVVRGDYVYDRFDEDLSFTVDNRWRGRLFPDGFGLDTTDGIGGLYVFTFSGLVGGGECGLEEVELDTAPETLAQWLADHPALDAGEVTEVNHAGLPGLQIEVVALPDECLEESFGYNLIYSPPVDSFYVLAGERVRFIIQEVGGDTVLTIVDDYEGSAMAELLELLETEFDSMVWGEAAPGGGDDDDDGEGEIPDTAMPGGPTGSGLPWMPTLGLLLMTLGGLALGTLVTRARRA